jgi:hypothetical protein
MEITNLWPNTWPGSNIAARFDVRLAPELVLCGLHLKRTREGTYRTYPPKIGPRSAFHIAPELAAKMSAAAIEALGRAHDRG